MKRAARLSYLSAYQKWELPVKFDERWPEHMFISGGNPPLPLTLQAGFVKSS